MLAPVVLAALLGPVCHGQLAPPTVVEQAMEFRRKFGLPAGRRHVRRVQRSGARRDDQGFGFTRREWRYWNQRYRVEWSDKRAVERYLARRPGLKAGISIEDDWPRRPYLQVLVTRNPERHQPALRERYRYRLRVVEVLHPVAELQALEERIYADRDALEAEGFDIRLVYYDVERGDVLVQMVSARTDHEAYFEARYGPYVTTFAVADEKQPACAELDGARVASDGLTLRLRWTYSTGDELSHVELTEHADRVEVGIVKREPVFGGPDDAHTGRTTVRLGAPLGNRRVIDAATGRPP